MLALAVRYYEPSPPPVIETDPELGNQLYKEAKRLLIDRFEREYLTKLIEEPDTTLSRASKQAGIERAYLTDLLRKHGLRVPGES